MKSLRILSLLAAIAIAVGVLLVFVDKTRDDAAPSVQTLQRGISSDPESLDPHKMRSVQAGEVMRDIGEGLVTYSVDGKLAPGSAESWSVSDDGLTYTFTIRDNARWSNGDPVTANDFVIAWRRLVNPSTAAFNAHHAEAVANATAITAGEMPTPQLGVKAADARTLVITLSRPTAYFLNLLTYPSLFPVHSGTLRTHGDAFARPGTMLSNGAYKLDAWEPGSVVKLSRNDHYWNDAATSIDAVNHHVVTQDMTELNRYRAGEIDVTGAIPADSFAQLRAERPNEMHVAPYIGVYYYGYNLTKPPFKDNPQLRQALSMAIDRETLVEKIIGRGELPAYSWVPPGVANYESRRFGYADMTQDERNTLAQRLYRDAGYSKQRPLQVEIRYNTSDLQQRTALAIQSMWRDALGFEATLVNESFPVLLENMREAEVTQVFRSSWIGDYPDAHTFLSILQSDNPSNMPRYANEEYDSLMQRAAEQLDPDLRRAYLEEAERELLADHPVIPIYFYVSKHLVSPRVQGWGDNVLDYHYSQHLSFATD